MAEGVVAGIGRWCFRHRWSVLGIWLVAVVLGGLSAGPVFDRLADTNNPRNVESVAAYDVLGSGKDNGGQVIALVDRVDPASTQLATTLGRAAGDLKGLADVKSVDCLCQPGAAADPRSRGLIAEDGRAVLVVVTLDTIDRADRATVLAPITRRLHALDGDLAAAGMPDARVSVGGGPVLNQEINTAVQEDLSRAEMVSLPITLVVLIIVFGGLIAAGLPVLAAAVSVAAAMSVLLGFSHVTDIDQNTLTVVTLLGLGLSVDYGLLLVARYREELGAGFAPDVAIGRAWATAGRTIMFSALTVAAALTGLLMFSISALSAMGAAGVSIALVAMLASITFTAAMLGLTKRWIKPSRREAERRARYGDAAEVGFFARLSRLVQRRPVLVVIVTSAALLAAGTPLLSATAKLPQLESIPRSIESVAVADQLASRFGREYRPTVLVVATTNAASLDTWAARWRSDPAVADVRPAEPDGTRLASVTLVLRGGSQDSAAQALVARIRDDRPPGVQSWVTGDAAVLVDLLGMIKSDLPLAVTVTLVAMVVLLFAMTGSLVIPVKAILANVVSLGASFGVMVAVFEKGYGAGLLDTMTVGGLNPFVVVIVFAFAFGLSMDYEVFLLGRIREYVERGWDTDTAVRRGLQHSGRIITSAAALMLVVFGCFAAARVGNIEEIGLGLAVAVLIDATIVRSVLVPATMTLLGRWNWWAPAPLQRLHARVGLRERPLPDSLPQEAVEHDSLAGVTGS